MTWLEALHPLRLFLEPSAVGIYIPATLAVTLSVYCLSCAVETERGGRLPEVENVCPAYCPALFGGIQICWIKLMNVQFRVAFDG